MPDFEPAISIDTSQRRHDHSLETLRGVAVLLMLLGHVIGDDETAGLRVAPDSWERYVEFSLMFVRMPLFTVISGYVYAMRPLQRGGTGSFLMGKGRRLLIPFLVVGSLQLAVRAIAPGTNRPVEFARLWEYYVFGFDQFWFLQALFVLFSIVAFCELRGGLETPRGWTVAFAIACLASVVLPRIDVFSGWGTVYLAPYFLLGLGLRRFADRVDPSLLCRRCLVVFTGGVLVQQLVWFGVVDTSVDPMGLLGLAVGLTGTTLLMCRRITVRWLAIVGSASFVIYLFHVFGTAGARIVTSAVGIEFTPFLLLTGVLGGIAVPLVVDALAQRNEWTRLVLLGLRRRRTRSKRTSPAPVVITVELNTPRRLKVAS